MQEKLTKIGITVLIAVVGVAVVAILWTKYREILASGKAALKTTPPAAS